MLRLILSDIHGNIDALDSVLRDAAGRYDEIVCCGDIVGYGASPAEVIEWARGEVKHCIRGNHDRAVWEREAKSFFNEAAREAINWSIGELASDHIAWLRALPAGPMWLDDCGMAHGSPADEDEYLIYSHDLDGVEKVFDRRICFFGHTHVQGGWVWERDRPHSLRPPTANETQRVIQINEEDLYLVNPGSVGQPRDRDPRAAYAILDTDSALLTFRRVRYDVRSAQNRILAAGLPESLAERLAGGA